jgi:hypothetical protein
VRQLCLLVAGKRLCAFFIEGQTACTAQGAAKKACDASNIRPEKSNI